MKQELVTTSLFTIISIFSGLLPSSSLSCRSMDSRRIRRLCLDDLQFRIPSRIGAHQGITPDQVSGGKEGGGMSRRRIWPIRQCLRSFCWYNVYDDAITHTYRTATPIKSLLATSLSFLLLSRAYKYSKYVDKRRVAYSKVSRPMELNYRRWFRGFF